MRIVMILNAIASCASAAWGALALMHPEALSGSSDAADGDRFYVRMYAARAIPFGITTALLPLLFKRNNAVAWVLFSAAAVQGFDVMIAVRKKQPGMAVGAAIGTTVHLACGLTMVL